jgi:hypothetical protein
MNDDPPRELTTFCPAPAVVVCRRVGKKSLLQQHPTGLGSWLELGYAPEGSASSDPDHAIIFYRKVNDCEPEIRIVLPFDIPFRRSKKGQRKGHTKSFYEDGRPTREVLLLYALKVKTRSARRRALEQWNEYFFDGETFGEIFENMDALLSSPRLFSEWAGNQIAYAASSPAGLADWSTWEKVADTSVEEADHLDRIAYGEQSTSNSGGFVQAVRASTLENKGIPTQQRVREIWEACGGRGEWREARDRLGFSWLPSFHEWKTFRRQEESVSREGG